MKKLLRDYVRLLRGRDGGVVAITFLLSLPLLLLILSLITQYALIINARIVLDHAVAAAARSAMVALPTDPAVDKFADDTPMDGVVVVNRAADMELASISPRAQSGSSDEAQQVTAALQAVGLPVADSYADQFTFAAAATTITWQRVDANGNPVDSGEAEWQPANFAVAPGQRIKLTVQYNFYLNAPGVKIWGPVLSQPTGLTTIAGVTGYFIPITSSYIVQLSPGREAATASNGYPLNPPALDQ